MATASRSKRSSMWWTRVFVNTMRLRPYQVEAENNAFELLRTHRSTLFVAATGLGKGVMIASMAERMLQQQPDKIVMVFSNRSKIIKQLHKHCSRKQGRHVAIEMADQRVDMNSYLLPNIIVGTIQTQRSGGDGLGRMSKVSPDLVSLVIYDEAHGATSPSSKRVVDYYMTNPECKLAGFTATPDRSDGTALGILFESVACNYDIQFGVNEGWLVKPMQQMVTVSHLDISAVHTVAGDFNAGELAVELEKDKPLFEIATVACRECKDKSTIIFCVSVKQAERLTEVINSMKPNSARVVHGKTPDDERDTMYSDFERKEFQYISNCAVLCEGYDNPNLEFIVDAAMTKSRSRYTQKLGRELRPLECIAHALNDCASADERKALIASSTKPYATYLDLVGNCGRHHPMFLGDILGGKYSDEVKARARKIAVKKGDRGEAVDIEDVLAKAEAELAIEKARQAARRAKIKADATYTLHEIDPFNVFALVKIPDAPSSHRRQPTQGMIDLLRKQGVKDAESLSFTNALKLIKRIKYGWSKGLASMQQQALLRKFGYTMPVTRETAKKLLDAEFARRRR